MAIVQQRLDLWHSVAVLTFTTSMTCSTGASCGGAIDSLRAALSAPAANGGIRVALPRSASKSSNALPPITR